MTSTVLTTTYSKMEIDQCPEDEEAQNTTEKEIIWGSNKANYNLREKFFELLSEYLHRYHLPDCFGNPDNGLGVYWLILDFLAAMILLTTFSVIETASMNPIPSYQVYLIVLLVVPPNALWFFRHHLFGCHYPIFNRKATHNTEESPLLPTNKGTVSLQDDSLYWENYYRPRLGASVEAWFYPVLDVYFTCTPVASCCGFLGGYMDNMSDGNLYQYPWAFHFVWLFVWEFAPWLWWNARLAAFLKKRSKKRVDEAPRSRAVGREEGISQ